MEKHQLNNIEPQIDYIGVKDFSRYHTIDIETNRLENPDTIWCAVIQNMGTKEIHTFRPEQCKPGGDLEKFLRNGKKEDYIWVGHNAISFDIPVLNLHFDGLGLAAHSSVVDTLVLSHLFSPNIQGGHSLDAWGKRLGRKKIEFDAFEKFTEEMLEYCVQDVRVTSTLFKALHDKMLRMGYSNLSAWIEHQSRIHLDNQQERGFYFDREEAKRLYRSLRNKQQNLEEKIHKLFPPVLKPIKTYEVRVKEDGDYYASYYRHLEQYPELSFSPNGSEYTVYDYVSFNIGSPKQRVEKLLSLGWKPKEHTEKGNPKTDESSLVEFAEESGIEEVQAIADWLVASGRANMINTWLDNLGSDSRIHGNVRSCGATTRRMTHSAPNTANIPSVEAPYGREARSLWKATPGLKLVGIDAKGLEARVLVHYLNNEDAWEFFIEGDPHTSNMKALQQHIPDKTRKNTKSDFYAFLYGASNKKLGTMSGGSSKLGGKVRTTLEKNIPGLERLVNSVEKEYKTRKGLLRTIDGGFVRCPSFHAALNYKFQSAGAIVMKLAFILLAEWIRENNIKAWKVGDIHDEWQIESDPEVANLVGEMGCASIRRAGELLHFNCPLDGDFSVGDNWGETH